MKLQQILLLIGIIGLSTTNIFAMRRIPATSARLTQTLLATRYIQSNTPILQAGNLTRSFSTAPRIPHPNWRSHICYKQVKQDPTTKQTYDLLEEQCDYTLQTLLRAATQDHNFPPLAFVALLEAGAQLNKPDEDGQTPLHLFAQNSANHFDESMLAAIFAHIARFNPDFYVEDKQGKTPADYAPENMKGLFKPHRPIDPAKLRYIYR